MRFGIIGSGSWATAIAKILTDNGHALNWWVRSDAIIAHLKNRHHNPHYLSSVYFDGSLLSLNNSVEEVIADSDCLILAVPSAYIEGTFKNLPKNSFSGKKFISAVKGMLPEFNLLINDYMKQEFSLDLDDYFTIMGPCHAEEIAAEKLSYLTFSGIDQTFAQKLATIFGNHYLNTIVNNDVLGVQYAAILKNIYALGSGIAHGLEYGDNFLSVLIANSADEMAGFLRKVGISHIEVGVHEFGDPISQKKKQELCCLGLFG